MDEESARGAANERAHQGNPGGGNPPDPPRKEEDDRKEDRPDVRLDELSAEEREARVQEALLKGEMVGVEKRRRKKRLVFGPKVITEEQRKRFPRRFGRLIDHYVFAEVFSMWLMGFFGFLGFLIVNQLFLEGDKLLNPQIPTVAVLKMVFFNIPQHMTWSLPIAIVFATLMSMGRLAKDNELTAMFTNGISLYRLFLPFFILAFSNCILLFFVSEKLVAPAAAQQERLKVMYPLIKSDEERAQEREKSKSPTIVRLPDGRYFSARAFDKVSGQVGKVIIDGLRKDESDGEPSVIWVAGSGNISGSVITLNSPKKYIVGEDDQIRSMERPPTASIELGLELHEIVSDIRTPQELTQEELRRQQQTKKELGTNIDREVTDLWLRYSAAFAPLAFALVAMPLSLRAPRDERLLGLILTFILVLVYYVIYFVFKIMGYNGVIAPWAAAWMMNIVFFVISIIIFATSRK